MMSYSIKFEMMADVAVANSDFVEGDTNCIGVSKFTSENPVITPPSPLYNDNLSVPLSPSLKVNVPDVAPNSSFRSKLIDFI